MRGTKMFKGLFLVLLGICIRNSACVIDVLFEAGEAIWRLHPILDEVTLDNRATFNDVNNLLFGYIDRYQYIKMKINKIHKQLDGIEKLMNPKIIRDSFELSPAELTISMCMDKIEMSIVSIDEYYRKFYQYSDETSRGATDRLYEFLRNHIVDIQGHVELMRKIIFDAKELLTNHTNLVSAIAHYGSFQREKLCNGPQMISDILIQLFRMVIIAEMKFTFINAITSLYLYGANQGWKVVNRSSKMKFMKEFENNIHLFTQSLELTDELYLRACDPNGGKWIRDKSFYELQGMVQTTIFRYHWGICKYGSCNDIQFILPNRCEATSYDIRTGCSHAVAECVYLNAIEACALRTGPYRFQFVNSSKLGSLGRNFECPKDNGYMIEDGTGLNMVYSACACDCYSNRNKISLLIMESKISANKVITGLRLIRQNEILYIQPREGKLDGNGYIHRHSQKWITLPWTRNSTEIHPIDKSNSVFFLDDVRLPPYFALTGVKFNKVIRGKVTGFAIEVFGLPFDYKSGKLDTRYDSQRSKQGSSNVSGRNSLFVETSSLYTTLPHSPSAMNIKFVRLKRSKLGDDFGQSTLPLFDGVPITCSPPTVLSGFGIFHKSVEGYAGFISLRLYGVAYAKYFKNFTDLHITDQPLFKDPK